ncbi:MAG: glycosyltransferase family 4 protein [Anaerolineales bacterium]
MNDPLRVLYVLNSASGGATQGIVEMLKGLTHSRYQAYIVIPNSASQGQLRRFEKLAARTEVVPMSWWSRSAAGPLPWRTIAWGSGAMRTTFHARSVATLHRLIRQWGIHLVYTNTAVIFDGALAARMCGLPHLWHIKECIGRHGRVKFTLPDRALTRIISALSGRVIVMSRFIGEVFERHGLEDSLLLLPDAVNLHEYAGNLRGEELRRKLTVRDHHRLIGMVASLSSTWKQHQLFIQMAGLLAGRYPELRFVVFGREPKLHRNPTYNRPWEYYQNLKREVQQRRLGDRFIWAGYWENIPQMMDALDILVHPCEIEPFGRIAIETMAAGRPVVGPDRGGIAETVRHRKTGLLVEAGNEHAFAEAVERLIQNKELRLWMGENGRTHVASHFSLRQHVDKVSAIYDEIAAGSIDRRTVRQPSELLELPD